MISWLFKAAKTGEVKTLAQAIRAFFQKNNRMPSVRERNTMGSILQDITKKSNVVEFPKDRITNPFKPRPGDVKKTDESPLSTLLSKQSKELEGIDTTKGGMGFYSELGDTMKKHRREELELKYDEMYNKILNKAKRIESDPLPLLEAELGKKLTGKETTTELLEIFKNRPKKASGGIARVGYFLGDLVKEKIPAEYRLYAKSILPGGEEGKVGSDYFTEDFKQELRKQALDKYKRTGKLRGNVGEVDQHRGDPTVNELTGFPSTYASLGTYTYDINPKTLDVKITDRYDWNPAYGKQKIADTEVIGWIGDKKGKDVDLPMLKDFAVSAVKEGWSPSSALELIGNYFGGKASEGKGFDVDIDIPTREATSATEGSFASGGIARVGFKKGTTRSRLQKDWESYANLKDLLYGSPPVAWVSPDKWSPQRDDEITRLKERFMYGEPTLKKDFSILDELEEDPTLEKIKAWLKERKEKASGGIAGPLHLYDGGRAGFDKGGMDRRGFLKLLGGLGALPVVGKFFKLAKPAAKAVSPAAEVITRGADGIPSYVYDLINVVKAKGTKEIMEGFARKTPVQKKYTYKGVDVVEDGMGNTSVQKQQMKTGQWTDQASDKTIVDDYVDREVGFEIRRGDDIVKDEGLETQKAIRGEDEYNESTAFMQGDPEGGLDVSEVLETISDADHLELKKIADESLIKKAEGGRVSLSKGGLAKILGV